VLDVGRVSVVERDPDVIASRDGVEQRQEPIVAYPEGLLALVEAAPRDADAVKREVDRTTPHHCTNADHASPLARRTNLASQKNVRIPAVIRARDKDPAIRVADDDADESVPPS
jgi:hypothetical protein